MRYLRFIILGLITALVLVACAGGDSEETGEVASDDAPVAGPTTPPPTPVLDGQAVVYVVGPLSGLDAEKGQAQSAGARFAANSINAVTGLVGREVEVRVLNDRGTPEGAQEAAQMVLTAVNAGDEVVGVVLYEASDPQLTAVRDVYLSDAYDGLVVIPASANVLTADLNDPRLFRLSAPALAQSNEIIAVLKEGDLPDMVLMHSANEFDRTMAAEFQATADEQGILVRDIVEVPSGQTEFTDLANRIRGMNPSALVLATDELETALFLPELYDSFFGGTVYALNDTLVYPVVDEVGCQAEGMYRTSVLPDPNAVMSQAQLTQYANQQGRVAEPFTVAGHAAVEFIAGAYNAAGTLEGPTAVSTAYETEIPTVLGPLNFTDAGTRVDPRIHFLQVRGRTFAESFAREVGAPLAENTDANTGRQTLLDQDFDGEPLVFAGLNWNSVLFHNAIARYIIESGYGYPTHAISGSSVPLFLGQMQGEIDITMEVWLPNELYEEAVAEGLVFDVGAAFEEAEQGWYVPRYMIEGDSERNIAPITPDLVSVQDLENYVTTFASPQQPSLGQLMDGSPGWFAYKHNCMKLKSYRLDDNFVQVTTGSDVALFGALDTAYQAGDPVLVYLWEPTYPIAKYDLVRLEEPEYSDDCWNTNKACAYPATSVRTTISENLPERAPEVVAFLEAFAMDKDDISRYMLLLIEENLTHEDAALRWLAENEAIWNAWVPNEVAEAVRASLEN